MYVCQCMYVCAYVGGWVGRQVGRLCIYIYIYIKHIFAIIYFRCACVYALYRCTDPC